MASPVTSRARQIAEVLPEAREKTREQFAAGKLDLALRHHEAYALALAGLMAGSKRDHEAQALRRAQQNIAFSSSTPAGDAPAASPPCAGASKFMPGVDRLLSNIIQHGKAA